jgi:hypothetical protein
VALLWLPASMLTAHAAVVVVVVVVGLQIALIWGLLASACCIFYPVVSCTLSFQSVQTHMSAYTIQVMPASVA